MTNFLCLQVRFYGGSQALLQYPFLFFSAGLDTGWALPLKILNHVSLGVDVPVFFHPGMLHLFPISSQWLPNTKFNYTLKRCFSIWVAHSLRLYRVQTVQGFVRPCPFARTGWLLAQQPSTRFRVPCSGLRVIPFYCFLGEFLYNFTIPFRIILIRIILNFSTSSHFD